MNWTQARIYIVFSMFLSLLCLSIVSVASDLPEILDYYPNCDYTVINTTKVRMKTDQPLSTDTTLNLLTKLRKKALAVDADALILIDKKTRREKNKAVTHGLASSAAANYIVSYQAELISQCKGNNSKNQKLAPYNNQGHKVIDTLNTTTTIETTYTFTPLIKEKLNHPIITNKELSLANGLYGVKIGTSYQSVVEKLGDPSVEFFMFKGEVVIGYGRSHWLHFRSGRLVNIQSDISILSPTLLNKIPLRDFFDDSPWLIANQIMHRSLLSEVTSVLAGDIQLSSKKEVVMSDQNNSLILYFSASKNHDSGDTSYILDGFSLQDNSYIKSSYQIDNRKKAQLDTLGLAFSSLVQDQEVKLASLSGRLGEPLGRITLSVNAYIDIYNSNMLVEAKRSRLVSLQLLEELFNKEGDYATELPWKLGDFIQGKSKEQLRSYFPVGSFELDDTVQVEAEKFQLTLLFDDSSKEGLLYEAEVLIY
ncbi:hypothetical protein [Colwellia psychrerythraea]|uniref:Uncharacterized protein n=1 Tax=Colwellia psychrerythraea TaxID=28229 RepID=A0A099L4C9_COLPS|nr:hypothetical protein [Colwellia psychrerythraea]KGJ97305.1 hypothetical protein GAB14E_0894 [Colwellia psychrerythraea]